MSRAMPGVPDIKLIRTDTYIWKWKRAGDKKRRGSFCAHYYTCFHDSVQSCPSMWLLRFTTKKKLRRLIVINCGVVSSVMWLVYNFS